MFCMPVLSRFLRFWSILSRFIVILLQFIRFFIGFLYGFSNLLAVFRRFLRTNRLFRWTDRSGRGALDTLLLNMLTSFHSILLIFANYLAQHLRFLRLLLHLLLLGTNRPGSPRCIIRLIALNREPSLSQQGARRSLRARGVRSLELFDTVPLLFRNTRRINWSQFVIILGSGH